MQILESSISLCQDWRRRVYIIYVPLAVTALPTKLASAAAKASLGARRLLGQISSAFLGKIMNGRRTRRQKKVNPKRAQSESIKMHVAANQRAAANYLQY
jgi:hypothetical protein